MPTCETEAPKFMSQPTHIIWNNFKQRKQINLRNGDRFVLFEVWTEYWNIIYMRFGFKDLLTSPWNEMK
jgi:hypothetical protein